MSYPLLLYLQITPPGLVRTIEDPRLLSNYNYVRGTWPRDTRHTSDIWTMAGTMETQCAGLGDQATLALSEELCALCQSKLIFNRTLMVSSGLKKLFEYN